MAVNVVTERKGHERGRSRQRGGIEALKALPADEFDAVLLQFPALRLSVDGNGCIPIGRIGVHFLGFLSASFHSSFDNTLIDLNHERIHGSLAFRSTCSEQ